MNDSEIEQKAKLIWDYLQMKQDFEKADVIVVMGSHDIQVADRGAELFIEGYAPLIVMSGGLGKLTSKMWRRPEAAIFTDRAIELGVPRNKIFIENKSKNTGENVVFTKKLLKKKGVKVKSVILVQKPYMERRAYATFKKIWPGVKVFVTSPQISFTDYKSSKVSREKMINIMVGDLQRVIEYPSLGYQIKQEVPTKVLQAYEDLVKAGYISHLIK